MWVKTLQKITSFFLIFFLLFSFTIRIPLEIFFWYNAYAWDKDFYNLVSIIVDEDTYDEVRTKLVRYSRDIQGVLENTRVVILPTPSDASALDIASLNESLFFEWYKAHKDVDFESRLIGTVIVWNLPVPVVFDGGVSGKSILPYVDFEDKSYIYDHVSGKYEKNDDTIDAIHPEIWHGVISPNTWDASTDVQAIQDYFDKNHDFYTWAGVFDQDIWVIDGKNTWEPSDYESYVFYYDQFRENEALVYQSYVWYQMYLQNIEDITYNRYSKELAEKIKDQVLWVQNAEISDLIRQVDPDFDISSLSSGPDASNSSDVLSRYITDNTSKKFLEIFNGSTLWDMRKHVYNAGRYNQWGSRVNMDMPPFLISVLDAVTAEVIKNVNTSLESDITDIVTGGLARDIEIPVRVQWSCSASYENFYYGLWARGVTNAAQCSIYRWSYENGWQVIEANRWRNINLVQEDTLLCAPNIDVNSTTGRIDNGVGVWWGWNTPVNLAGQELSDFALYLWDHNPRNSYLPLYDILGSDVTPAGTPAPSPLDCFRSGTYMQVESKEQREHTYTVTDSDGNSEEKTHDYCAIQYVMTVPESGIVNPREDIDYYRWLWHDNGHDYVPISSKQDSWERFCIQNDVLSYSIDGNLSDASQSKTISSHIVHTSPTDEEFGLQTQSLFTPALPINTDRYIDFIWANGWSAPDYGYQRIDFPQLFRVINSVGTDLTLENTEQLVKQYLDDISENINQVIRDADPSDLSWSQRDEYETLSTGTYPNPNIDLYADLISKPLEVFTLDNQSKEISYFDTLVFAVYWNNLKTVSSKYKFIFQNYLSNQFEGNDYRFHLPKSKKSYESAYIAAPGDASNMYIKLDPELKTTHPYAGILARNLELSSTLSASSVWDLSATEWVFECAPPDGVNIFQWIPAVVCWLKNMLPPTIKIGESSCWAIPLTQEQEEEIAACSKDENNNGINDCLEEKLVWGSLFLASDAGRYYYNSPWVLTTKIFDSDDEIAYFDNSSYLRHTLTRVEVPADKDDVFDSSNLRVIYDRDDANKNSEEDYQEAQKYIGFNTISPRALRWEARAYFYWKWQDMNAYFQSDMNIQDVNGDTVVDLTSDLLRVEVRWERLLLWSYIVEESDDYYAGSEVRVSQHNNICIADRNAASLAELSAETYALSDADEKVLLTIENISLTGNKLELQYPLDLKIFHKDTLVFEQTGIAQGDLSSAVRLFQAQKSWEYEIYVKDANDFTSRKIISLLPEIADKMDVTLGSNIVESGWNISTHFYTITDRFDNLASANIYNVEANISWNTIEFEDGSSEKTFTIAEWYKAFRIKSKDSEWNNTITFTLRDISGNVIDTVSSNIRVIDDIQVSISEFGDVPKVGWEEYSYDIVFTDAGWNILSDLSSRVYMSMDALYGRSLQAYTQITWWRSRVLFTTSSLAGKNVFLDFQIEWGNEIYKKSIDILPEAAIKIDLSLSHDKIEASPDDSSILQAVLKDRYNNDVFTDSSSEVRLEVSDQSLGIISVDDDTQTVEDWYAQFIIKGTDIPGIWYFKVEASPDLSLNSFSLIGQAPFSKEKLIVPTMKDAYGDLTATWKKFFKNFTQDTYISLFITESLLTQSEAYKDLASPLRSQILDFWNETNALEVSWLSENAWNIETFFFWDKDDIDGSAYNGLYSVLLWAQYWDITQENYLGGSLLFDRGNSSLAVTSLINNPYTFFDVVSLWWSWSLTVSRSSDITQDITLKSDIDPEGRLYIDIYNQALSTYVARAYYLLDSSEGISLDLWNSQGYRAQNISEWTQIISPDGGVIATIYNDGRFERKSDSMISIDEYYAWEWQGFTLYHNAYKVADIKLNHALDINITRDQTLLENKLDILSDTVLVYLSSQSYSSREVISPSGEMNTKLYYHDPFAKKYSLDSLHKNDALWLESSYDESWIGWQDPNMSLLQFSAGESVWEATKNFQSFSMINLWDPVVSLKAHSQTFPGTDTPKSFDSTLWEVLIDESNLIAYQTFDYNNDATLDIISIHKDGYIRLLEWDAIHWWFIEQRSIVLAVDGWSSRLVKAWDFTWDGYGDIFFVSETWAPQVFNNYEKDFSRIELQDQFSLSGSIIQAEVYDMDDDGNDDIVTLDDSGEIYIFYGSGEPENPVFTKKYVWDGYAIELSSTSISHGGAIYYDGLTQIDPNNQSQLLWVTQAYLDDVTASVDSGNPDALNAPEFINESLVNNLIYVWLPYIPTDYDAPDLPVSESIIQDLQAQSDNLGPDAASQGVGEGASALWDFFDNYDAYIDYSWYSSKSIWESYFLRSQYAESEGVEISKKFIDATPPNLQTWDRVNYEITITNTSSSRKNNVAYVDSIPKYFKFIDDDYIIVSEDNTSFIRKPGIWNYNILLDGFYLDPGETVQVRYELETLPLSYGHMQVGLYETGELWDDIYGDIILKEDEKNCGKEAKIYRSTDTRSYIEWTTVPSCETSDVEVWNTFPDLVDDDNNGIPDYLDTLLQEDVNGNLVPTSNTDAISDYSSSVLNDLFEDSDGEQIDEIIEWLSCWFWWGSCFANPLNWAPLAPWNDPTLFGMPIWDGLRVNEGYPVFSALTWMQMSCWFSPCCIPSVHPVSSATFVPGPFCSWPGAGWSLGVTSPTNYVRMFVTPTLTGAGGIAVCFWWPAIVQWNLPPPWVSPIAPGWNCIVAAMPLFGCEWWEGNPWSLWYPQIWDFWVIHANCDGNIWKDLSTPQELSANFIEDYFDYLETWVTPAGMYDEYVSSFSNNDQFGWNNFTLPSEPLINIGWWEGLMSTSVDLDLSQLQGWNFQDVVDINNKSIGWFPNFLMDWVERQLDEVTSKLTNLTKVYVILPDFGWIFDWGFGDFGEQLQQVGTEGVNERENTRQSLADIQAFVNESKAALDCDWEDSFQCRKLDLELASVRSWISQDTPRTETLSWIKQVYEFVWNIPLVNIESEKISVNVPWIEPTELNRFIADWEITAEQWKSEVDRASRSWSLGGTCSWTASEIARCESENDIRNQAHIDAKAFVSTLERNIEILHEYKKFPEKLAKLINIKEDILYQVLCNIDALSKIMWEWIKTNGERFKAWVELFMLIKAILKSWQLFIDVFNGYEAECHECKNERQDLNSFVFRLISMVIPSPPIIEFPKWPDIILDFHNIRAGMTIYMPEFEMNMRPIVLPTLPELRLPDVPEANLNLPELPVLPLFEIPEIDINFSIPTIELPDLPPPPKIPKLFGPVEAVLNITKLVTKAMCLLKQSPFVPEWRAGDQIAFLTERNGYLPTDFIDVQFPTFSYSTISAIKVTTYVNLEFETEFILEAVRAITAPIDNFSNNIVNMFDLQVSDVDLRGIIPEEVDINIELDGSVSWDTSSLPNQISEDNAIRIAGMLSGAMLRFLDTLTSDQDILLDNKEFIVYMQSQIANEDILWDAKNREFHTLWKDVSELTYSKEQAFIDDMLENSNNKFGVLKDILSTEMQHAKEQRETLKNIQWPEAYIQVNAENDTRIEKYSSLLEPYNIKTVDAAINLMSGESHESKAFREDLDREAQQLMQEVRWGLTSYKENLLADHTPGHSPSAGWSCVWNGSYEYRYEWIYVLEDDKNYKLFDYTDILRGDEVPDIVDVDGDGDDDVLYLAWWKLYFKENRKNTEVTNHFSTPPLILSANDNKFYNGEEYFEAINLFQESWVSDGAINLSWARPTNPQLQSFRLQYHTIVDRYLDESDTFTPSRVQTHIVDSIAWPWNIPVIEETSVYTVSPNIGTLTYAGAVNGAKLTTQKLIDIRDQISQNIEVVVTRGTPIYAWGQDFTITYENSAGEEESLSIEKYTQVSFNAPIEITGITWNGYISLWIFEDIENAEILDYIGKPILADTRFSFDGNESLLSESSHMDIRYYDGSELEIDLRDVQSYRLHDLWDTLRDDYVLRLELENDFYYARIWGFWDNISGTKSKQILLSPQKYADTFAPEIWLSQKIRIPVYQEWEVDLTWYLYEDGWLWNIHDVRVDFDLSDDLDGDGDPRNDSNTENINVNISPIKISLDFWPYEELFEKDIVIMVEDNNGNIWSRQVAFEVYAPNPSIESLDGDTILWAIDESLLEEPVRLYRYRGWVIEKLQNIDGTDLIETDAAGNYNFETLQSSSWVTLTFSWSQVASIDEYTWKISLTDALVGIKVLPSNNPENTSIYPEVQIQRLGQTLFRQFIKIPEWEVLEVSSFDGLENTWIYFKVLDQDNFNSFRVPLGVNYNPWSVSLYESNDDTKTPIMTVFADGRVHIDEENYKLIYSSLWDNLSLVLQDASWSTDIARLLYFVDASYVLR